MLNVQTLRGLTSNYFNAISRLAAISIFHIISIFHRVRYRYSKIDKLHLHLCVGVFLFFFCFCS